MIFGETHALQIYLDPVIWDARGSLSETSYIVSINLINEKALWSFLSLIFSLALIDKIILNSSYSIWDNN